MLKNLKQNLLSDTSRGTAVLGTGNIVSAILAVIFTIIVARNLGPEKWGSVAVSIGLAAITQAIFDLGIGSALFRFKADQNKTELKKLYSLRIISALLAVILIFIFYKFILNMLFPKLNPTLGLIGALSGIVYLLFDFFVTWEQSKRNYILASLYLIINNTLRIVLTLILAYTQNITSLNILVVYFASPLILSLLIIARNSFILSFEFSQKYFYKIFKFSGFLGLNRIIGVLTGKLDTLLVFTLLTSYETGIYSAAKQLAFGIPLLVGSLATVIASRYANLEGQALKKYFYKTLLLSVFLSVGLAITSLIAPLIIKLFGPSYGQSGWVLRYLILVTVPFVLATPAVNLLIYSFGKTKIVAVNSAIMLVIVYTANTYLIPFWGIHGVIATQLFAYLYLLIASFAFALKYLYQNNK